MCRGGADSDILVDLCERTVPHFVNYVFFNTGIEYQATKEHLIYLEDCYDIDIEIRQAIVPVPLGNKKYGSPFLSKQVSEYIGRLQKHNFQWEDESFEILYKKYPKCKAALLWWCNNYGDTSKFNINRNIWLKEFMIKNPPTFKISPKCCDGAKKKLGHSLKCDLQILGVRKAEGGIRSTAYKNIFDTYKGSQRYYPILFFSDADRKEYEEIYNIKHSKCYSEYGLKRTGCAGCPYGRDYNFERQVIKDNEPKLYKAVENMWGDVYEYTDKYHEFQNLMNLKYKKSKKCVCGCEEFIDDDVAMNLKYFGRDCKTLLCRGCFQNVMGMTDIEWNNAIEGFKAQGCQLF